MSKLSNILSIVLYALLAVTVVLTILFFTGGEVPGEAYTTPVYTDLVLNWAKFLVIIAAGVTILFEVVNVVLNPKNAMRSLISIAVLIVIAFVSYSLADDSIMKLEGYDGPDNVPSMLKLAGAFLYGTYALLGIVVVAIVGTELSRLFK